MAGFYKQNAVLKIHGRGVASYVAAYSLWPSAKDCRFVAQALWHLGIEKSF